MREILKFTILAALNLSIIWTASAQTPSASINGTPPPYIFNGAGVSQVGQTFTFSGGGSTPASPAGSGQYNNGGSLGATGTLYIAPSADSTGATDRAAINTAIATGNNVVIQTSKGKFYIDATGLTMASPNTTSCDSWNNPIQFEGLTGYLMQITFDIPYPETVVSQMGVFRGCSLLLDSGVTQSAGGAVLFKPKDGTNNIMIAPQLKDLLINGAFYQDIDLEGPGIIIGTELDNVIMNHPLSTGPGCLHYNAPGPGGDMNFNNSFCFGAGTQAGMTVDQSDTSSISNLKINGAYINFTNGAATNTINMRFNNTSVEDLTAHCPFTVASASGTINHILVSGGEFVDPSTAGRLCSPSVAVAAQFTFSPSIDYTGDVASTRIAGSSNSIATNVGSGINDTQNDALIVYAGDGSGNPVTTQVPFTAGSYLTDLAFTCEFAGNNSGTWYAFGVYPTCIRSYQGTLYYYSDSGQTFGVSFTPTLVYELTPTGPVAPLLPTSAGAGGLYVCIDTAGVMYKKSSCP